MNMEVELEHTHSRVLDGSSEIGAIFQAKLDLATGIKFVPHFEIFISVIFGNF